VYACTNSKSGQSESSKQIQVLVQAKWTKLIFLHSADMQVRVGTISESGGCETRRLGKHKYRAHKLAIEPGSPHMFLSTGEDGFVKHVSSSTFVWLNAMLTVKVLSSLVTEVPAGESAVTCFCQQEMYIGSWQNRPFRGSSSLEPFDHVLC
jgi:hypothetical protein